MLWLGILCAHFQCPTSSPRAAYGHSRKAVSSVRLLMQEDKTKPSLETFLNKVVVQTSKAVQESARATESAVNDYVNSGWQVKKRAGQLLPEIRPNAADIGERRSRWAKCPLLASAHAASHRTRGPPGC